MENAPMVHPTHLRLTPLPSLSDNYIWALDNGEYACEIDPGESAPVVNWLRSHNLQLKLILLTHHHRDHTGGVKDLLETSSAQAWGPAFENLPDAVERVSGGERIDLLGHEFEVLDVPGHTAGHIAFYAATPLPDPLLFCGDTLFSAGCGRIFEGTPEQLFVSLSRLSALPLNTLVCCTHEYTLSNLQFALAVEPDNTAILQHWKRCLRLRENGLPTLPSSIATELAINPFLRVRETGVRRAAQTYAPKAQSEVDIFAALRQWKDNFTIKPTSSTGQR